MKKLLAVILAGLLASWPVQAQQISGGGSAAGASGLTIGTTTITSGTDTRILYDNAGVLGEYTLTGTGTVAVMQASPTFTGVPVTPRLSIAGSISAAAWTTTGLAFVASAASYTDTSSSGTVAAMYVHRLGIPTILASSSTTYTSAYGLWVEPPTASTNVTITNNLAAGFNGTVAVWGGSASVAGVRFAAAASTSSYGGFSFDASNDASVVKVWINNGFSGAALSSSGIRMPSTATQQYNLAFGGTDGNWGVAAMDAFISRKAAATIRLGAWDAASPVSQTLTAQGSRVGTDSNVAGGGLTIKPGVGTGNATPAVFAINTWVAVASGTTTQTDTATLTATAGLVSLPAITTDATHTDSTLCQDTTTHAIYFGSGALGICLGTSGRQFKTDFAPMTAGLSELLQIDFQNFRYKRGFGDNGERRQYGAMAQDVSRVLPDLAGLDANGEIINYDYGALFFVGLRATQELAKRIERLEAQR